MKRVIAAVLAVLTVFGLAGCQTETPPDQVALYYDKGYEGYKFVRCLEPGTNGYPINDEMVFLPASLRTWNIAPDSIDQTTPITVNSAPEEGQPSGVQVNLWTWTNFTINTDCGEGGSDPNSPAVQFWERVARRYYEADTTPDKSQWWPTLLKNTIVPALETVSRSVIRGYQADVLVSGAAREEAQEKIAELFQAEIRRAVGGEYFCAPDFDRVTNRVCGEVQVVLKDVDYANPGVQAARDEKQAAIERASALLVEAQARVDAADLEGQLYDNPARLELELAKIQLEQARLCAASANCTMVLSGGGVNINAGSRS